MSTRDELMAEFEQHDMPRVQAIHARMEAATAASKRLGEQLEHLESAPATRQERWQRLAAAKAARQELQAADKAFVKLMHELRPKYRDVPELWAALLPMEER